MLESAEAFNLKIVLILTFGFSLASIFGYIPNKSNYLQS